MTASLGHQVRWGVLLGDCHEPGGCGLDIAAYGTTPHFGRA